MSSDTWEGPPSGTIIAGRYRLVKQLGAGGMGQVFLVQHIHTDERLALKALLDTVIKDENALERFRREARTPARIDSDHVVRVTDADVAPELKNSPFLVMEYLKGEDLDHYLARVGSLPPRDVVQFLRQIARVLDKAHGLGIIHRDLKPENIFVTQREDGSAHLKILDFGIAKFTGSAATDLVHKTATSPGEIFGTPMFMAPEQAKSEAVSAQTDIWALGLIAHKMLTNDDYWTAQTLTALIAQIVYEPMKTPTEKGYALGPKYDEWLLQCCARDPADRFPSAGAAVRALAAAFQLDSELGIPDAAPSLRANPIPARSTSITPARDSLSKTELQLATTGVATARPEPRGSTLKLLLALAATVIVGGAILFWFSRRDDASRAIGTAEAQPAVTTKETAPAQPSTRVEVGAAATPATTPEPPASVAATVAPSASAVAAVDTTKPARPGVSAPRPPASAPPPTNPPASAKPATSAPPATTGGDELNSRY
ncbi:MAG: serine/threonine-protein kinase [Polyangiaceae bacterium]